MPSLFSRPCGGVVSVKHCGGLRDWGNEGGGAYVDFVEEVAASLLSDNRVYILEDKKAGRHKSSLLKDIPNIIRARRRLDVKAWNREPITSEKRVHQCLDGDCFPIPCRPYRNFRVSTFVLESANGPPAMEVLGEYTYHEK